MCWLLETARPLRAFVEVYLVRLEGRYFQQVAAVLHLGVPLRLESSRDLVGLEVGSR
jgi:hypothetical protein